MTRTGHRYLAEAFAACGVSHFFHVPVVIAQATKDMMALGVQPIVNHSEKAAAYMADGYARASGRLGVCGCQQIGAANLAAGLADAFMARSPVLAIAGGGTAESRERHFYQEYDQRPIYSGLTKFSARVEKAERLPDLLNLAMRAATTGAPGPVHLELAGFLGASFDTEFSAVHQPEPRFARAPAVRYGAAPDDIAAAAHALRSAERPIVVAGSGIRTGRAESELRTFVHALGLPLATSLDAKGALPESDPLYAGVCGNYSRDTANMSVAEADLVVFVGSTTGSMATRDWAVPRPGVATIQIDIDPRELGRNYPLVAGLAGDPATVLDQLTAAAGEQPDRSAWLSRIGELRSQWAQRAQEVETSEATPIRPERLCRDVSDALPDGALVVVDTGHSGAWAARHIYLDRPGQGMLRAAGSLGWSYPASLGAKCAQPDRPVICFNGDGAFLYHFAEMETAMRYGINTVTVVNNNNAFSQENPIWQFKPEWDENWRFSPVSYAAVAEAFGCKAYQVDKPSDLPSALRSAVREKVPTIVEVMTDDAILVPGPWSPSGVGHGVYAAPRPPA